ncbi:MAG: hypothetical protein MUF28_05870 [Ignavibacterium sp.]|nr:hypothetical protein [Ignavibacterium sp.]
MKKYISTVLIFSVLFQFACSYTHREITYDDFYTLPNEQEAEVIINDGSIIKLNSDSSKNNYIYWLKGADTLIISSTHLEKFGSTSLIRVTDTVYYPKEKIKKVNIEEVDETRTILQITITCILVSLIIYSFSTLSFSGGN